MELFNEDDFIDASTEKPVLSNLQNVAGTIGSVGQGLFGSFLDEMTAGAFTPYDLLVAKLQGKDTTASDIYSQNLAQARAGLKQFQTESPILAGASEVVGAIASPINKLAIPVKTATGVGRLANIVKTGLSTAGQGALYGVGSAEGNENILENAQTGALLGGALGSGGQAISETAGALGNYLTQLGRGTKNQMYGLRYGDIKKSISKGAKALDNTQPSQIEKSLDNLIEAGQIKPGSAAENLEAISMQIDEIAEESKSIFNAVDSVQPDAIKPTWDNTRKYIEKNIADADKPQAMAIFEKYRKGIEDNNALVSEFEKQKSIFQKMGKNAMGTEGKETIESNIFKWMGLDLKKAVDNELDNPLYAEKLGKSGLKAIQKTRKEMQDRVSLIPVFEAGKAREASQGAVGKLIGLMRTSGGYGVPTILGAGALGPAGALLGLGAGAALQSTAGQQALVKILQGAGTAGQALGKANLGGALGRAGATLVDNVPEDAIIKDDNNIYFSESDFMDTTPEPTKEEDVISKIKANPTDHAIALIESGLNPKAKNPNSSASGLFQLINQTAKNVGVKDVFDPMQNYEGYQKLKQETIKELGTDDYRVIYSSHYLGLPTLKKWIKGERLTTKQQEQIKELTTKILPKLDKVYNQLTEEA